MATKTVTYSILRPNGSAWVGVSPTFRLSTGGYDATDQFPGSEIKGSATDSNGDGSVVLWANEGGEESTTYTCQLPSGETFTFTVPTAGGPFTLSELRELGAVEGDPQYQTLITYLQNRWRGDWEADPDTEYTTGDQVYYTGSSWIALEDAPASIPGVDDTEWGLFAGDPDVTGVDLAGSIEGKPGASETLLDYVVTNSLTLPSALTGSQLIATSAATSQWVALVKKNGVEVGTMTVAAAGTTATFAAASPASLVAGDRVTVVAPASQDSTLADIAFTIRAALA